MAAIYKQEENTRNVYLCSLHQPSNDRLVILQDIVDNEVKTIGAYFSNEKWIGEDTKEDMTSFLSSNAIWFEAPLSLPNSHLHLCKEASNV